MTHSTFDGLPREPMAASLATPLVKYLRTQAKSKRRNFSAEIEELLELGIKARDGEKVLATLMSKVEK